VHGKKLLFSLTKKDFKIQTFCTGGPGGQHQNSNQNGVRITHEVSGAMAEGREFRSQAQNKKAAFERLIVSSKFQAWHKLECARRLGQLKDIDSRVEAAMNEENLKVEYF
jgi:protein subunit release factor A